MSVFISPGPLIFSQHLQITIIFDGYVSETELVSIAHHEAEHETITARGNETEGVHQDDLSARIYSPTRYPAIPPGIASSSVGFAN